MTAKAIQFIPETKKGQVITARKLTDIATAINTNTRAIRNPREVAQRAEELTGTAGSGGTLTDESFSATATDITSQTVTITDSNGDTHDIERITQIVFSESITGREMTLNITY